MWYPDHGTSVGMPDHHQCTSKDPSLIYVRSCSDFPSLMCPFQTPLSSSCPTSFSQHFTWPWNQLHCMTTAQEDKMASPALLTLRRTSEGEGSYLINQMLSPNGEVSWGTEEELSWPSHQHKASTKYHTSLTFFESSLFSPLCLFF